MSRSSRQSAPTRPANRLRTAGRGEDGYTIMIAMVVLVVTLALATVALTATLSSRSHATRDLRSQRALQAADAGVNSGIYRFNQVNLANFNFTSGLLSGLTSLVDCVIPKASVSAPGLRHHHRLLVQGGGLAGDRCVSPA